MQTMLIPAELEARKLAIIKITRFLESLGQKAWRVEVGEYHATRSGQQNRYLFGVVYPELQKHLPGWDKDDVHNFMLGEWSGWEVLDGLGGVHQHSKPIRRSSKLTTVEFSDFVGFIQRRAAEIGVYIPDANERV